MCLRVDKINSIFLKLLNFPLNYEFIHHTSISSFVHLNSQKRMKTEKLQKHNNIVVYVIIIVEDV